MKIDKNKLYTIQQMAYAINTVKSTIEYRLKKLECIPIVNGNTNYYTYNDYLRVRNFAVKEVEMVDVVKYIDRFTEINWAFAHSRMNFENIDTRNWRSELKN